MEVETVSRTQILLSKLQESYESSFKLELAIYTELKGPHNKKARQEVARFLNLPDQNYNVVELADKIRAYFDLMRLF